MRQPLREVVVTSATLTPPAPRFDAAAGAVVDFHGVVREEEGEASIRGIDYEAFVEMARHQLDLLVEATVKRFPVHDLIVHHRIGFVPVATPSLFLRVTAAHRGPALAAVEWFIDEMKQRVPIWKHPVPQTIEADLQAAAA